MRVRICSSPMFSPGPGLWYACACGCVRVVCCACMHAGLAPLVRSHIRNPHHAHTQTHVPGFSIHLQLSWLGLLLVRGKRKRRRGAKSQRAKTRSSRLSRLGAVVDRPSPVQPARVSYFSLARADATFDARKKVQAQRRRGEGGMRNDMRIRNENTHENRRKRHPSATATALLRHPTGANFRCSKFSR